MTGRGIPMGDKYLGESPRGGRRVVHVSGVGDVIIVIYLTVGSAF